MSQQSHCWGLPEKKKKTGSWAGIRSLVLIFSITDSRTGPGIHPSVEKWRSTVRPLQYVYVHLGYCNGRPQSGCLIHSGNAFLTTLEVSKFKNQSPSGPIVQWEPVMLARRNVLFSGIFFIRALMPLMKLESMWLYKLPKATFLMPVAQEFRIST